MTSRSLQRPLGGRGGELQRPLGGRGGDLQPEAAGRPPRLRTVLLAVHLLILLLPLGGVSLLRLYDTQLIRRTESELIAQGAVIAAAFRRELAGALASEIRPGAAGIGDYGLEIEDPPPEPATAATGSEARRFRPLPPRLDRARDAILPPAPEAVAAAADPAAREAGRRMEEILRETQEVTLAGLRIVDFAGTVVASSGAEWGLALDHRPEVRSALRGESASVLRARISKSRPPALDSISRRTKLRVVVAMPVVGGEPGRGRVWGAVVLTRTPMSVSQALYRNRRYFLPGAVALLAVVGLVAKITARTLGRPIEQLIAQTARVRRGEEAALPLARPGTREVAQISRAVAEMARGLRERADYIAGFASSVSHELKTPLSSIRGTVELLRDHLAEMTPGELERFLTMLERDSARLERLTQRLLELARADVLRPGEETAAVGEVLAELAARFGGGGLEIRHQASGTADRVRMAPGVLESVLANVIDNARQHGGPEVRVALSARRVAGGVEIRVVDDGPGIPEADQGRVFDHFFTTARERGGSGLGLAIVRSLVEAHHGTIGLRSVPGRTELAVFLPAARPG